jgi:hypothetical protein
MTLVLALQKRRDRIPAGAPVEPQQHVIVAIKNWNTLG